MKHYVITNPLYNRMCCPNCWYIVTVLDPDSTYVCPKCGRKGDELVKANKEYIRSVRDRK